MRLIAAVFLFCLAAASAKYMTNEVKYADKAFMEKQKAIFEIFMTVYQPEIHNKYFEESQKWAWDGVKDKFTNAEAFEEFFGFYSYGFLGMEEIYSPMQSQHNEQMLSLFKMFYFAKDWDTFYHVMVWARFHINPNMFVQALTMGVLHRNDMEGFVLPAIYEVNPFYFFNNVVISKAQRAMIHGKSGMKKEGSVYSYTIPMNYTDYYVVTNHDSKLAYFMEGNLRFVCRQVSQFHSNSIRYRPQRLLLLLEHGLLFLPGR